MLPIILQWIEIFFRLLFVFSNAGDALFMFRDAMSCEKENQLVAASDCKWLCSMTVMYITNMFFLQNMNREPSCVSK